MKLKLIYLLSFFCLLMAGCSDDDPALVLSQTEFKEIASEGGVCKIEISTANEWTATSDNDWCKVSKEEGVLSHTLVVDVEGNLGEARTGQVTVSSLGVDYVITISQQGLEEGKELKYRIPIVFHVIYADEKDSTQNIPASTIYAMLDDVNQMYRNAGGTNTVDLNMEFVLAETDPQGNLLKEPGIDRVKWLTAELDAEEVMNDNTRKYVHFLWEPNDYVNILVYRFSANNILGISTFPYTTASHPMDGTDVLPDMNITLANLTYARCVSINSSFIGDVDDALTPYAPENYKEIITKQVDDGITLAHELGHYFGLRHAFPNPNRDILIQILRRYAELQLCRISDGCSANLPKLEEEEDFAASFDWATLFDRTNCRTGEKYISHNIMDYAYSYLDEFTADQRLRVRHVLDYSPMIPGPKQTRAYLSTKAVSDGPMDLPFSVSDCGPRGLMLKH